MMNREHKSPWSSLIVRSGLGAAAGAALLLVGCSKPPPPKVVAPPPPPPPPPATIKLEDVSQELHADARVQVAPGLEVHESEAEFARSVIRLADAIAKGDNKAARQMLTRNAQSVLDEIATSGGWADATKKIEAVRIVYVGGVPQWSTGSPDTSGADGARGADGAPGVDQAALMAKFAPKAMAMSQAIMAAVAKLPPPKQKDLGQVIAKIGTGGFDPSNLNEDGMKKTAAKVDELLTAMSDAGVSAEETQAIKASFDDLSKDVLASVAPGAPADAKPADAPAPALVISGQGFLIAVQEPSGSYLLGWQGAEGGGSVLFTNTPASNSTRPRASGWDGIGQAGFSDTAVASAEDDKPGSPNKSSPASDDPSSSPSDPAPSAPGPTRKNTPAGPVTIPGG